MKKILLLLLALSSSLAATNPEPNPVTTQQIDQQTASVVTPTPPNPSIKQRLSQKAATIAKLSKDLDDLQWKKLAIIPLSGIVIGGMVGTWLGLLLMPRIILKAGIFGGAAATGLAAIVGAAKLGNMIARKSIFGTKKTVNFVKEKLSSSSKKQ